MKYAFFGSPKFAATIIEKLIAANLPPALVVCNPDRPSGRKKTLTPPPAKLIAEKHGIRVWQPETMIPEDFAEKIGGLDFSIVAAYAKILPKEVLATPRLGSIGVHPSLLPKFRGTTPIQSAILSGEAKTGTTLFILDEKVDHGPVLAEAELAIHPTDTYLSLHEKLAGLSGDLLVKTLPGFLAGEIKPVKQNENEATFTKKFKTEDGLIDLDKESPEQAYRKIRALNPEPGAYVMKDGKRIKILSQTMVQIESKKPRQVKNYRDFLANL